MKIWVDDIRTPPDTTWYWYKNSSDTIHVLRKRMWGFQSGMWPRPEVMSLDHDLGGDDTTRSVVLWCCENDFWPVDVRVHSQNPVGVTWLQGMIERYKP